MTTAPRDVRHPGVAWRCPVDPTAYDRTPELSPGEQMALAEVRARRARPPAWKRWPLSLRRALARLLGPLEDVLDVTGAARTQRSLVIGVFIDGMQQNQRAFWGWTRELWCEALCGSPHNVRQYVLAVAYLLCDQRDLFDALPGFLTYAFASRIFGRAAVEASLTRVRDEVRRWGYQPNGPVQELHLPLAALLLASRSPALEDISAQALATVGNRPMGRSPTPFPHGWGRVS